jgi:hypothetical protein
MKKMVLEHWVYPESMVLGDRRREHQLDLQ